MNLKNELTVFALALVAFVGCAAALGELKEECSEANVSARVAVVAGACEARKEAECPKSTYPNLRDCPYMQRCLADLDAIQAECEGK